MEREPELVWNKHSLLDDEFGSAAEENMMVGISFNETDTIGNESAHYEKFLLDDFDNYVDEINDRLTVSRLVTDSIIKGIVNAVVEETAEKVALKEAEIARLKEMLRESNYIATAVDCFEPSMVVSEHLSRLKISVENQVKRLKEDFDCARNSNSIGLNNGCSANKVTCKFLSQVRVDEKFHLLGERIDYLREMLVGIFDEIDHVFRSMKASAMEQRWEHELHEEIHTVLVQNFVRDIREDCETKILEQRKMMNALNTNYQQKVSELSSLRDDLDAISKSLLNSDQSLLFSHTHSSSESLEELNNIRWKDQFHVKVISHNGENGATMMQEPPELEKFTDFPHLKHLSKEDLANYYKTEMIKMRRQHDKAMEEKTDELFRLKREFLKEKDSLLSKKDKELEQLKKNVRKIILNLDNILAEKEMLTVVNDDRDEVCCLKNKINFMFIENQRLQGLLIGKRKEVGFLSAQVTDATSQISLNTSINQKLSEQIAKLKGNLEDLNIEVAIKDEMDAIILNEVFSAHKLQMEDAEIEAKLIHDLYSVFVKESTRNEGFMINSITQQEEDDVVNQELDILRDQVSKQKLIISGNKIHSDFMRSQFDEALQQLTVYELEICCLNQKLAIASSSLEESERQKAILNDIIKDRENKFPYPIMGENMQEVKQTEVIVSLWKRLLEVSLDFESKLAGNIKRNESRLRVLSNQCSSLKQHVNLLLKKGFWYKRMFEIRNSNLQKAEAEVDLLGDEVDALLSVLGKVYVALDHYSPVLQHYPGVMEILKLVRRELQGETSTSSSISIAF